jgi:hypothetical protein
MTNALVVLGLTFFALERVARFHRAYCKGAASYRDFVSEENG